MTSEGIQVEIYKDTAPNELVDILNIRTTPQFLEELKSNGAGSFTVPKDDPKIKANPSLLDYRNIVKFRINGKIRGAILIQTKKTVIVGDGEFAQENWEISGEGLKSWFRDAVVYPSRGILKPRSKSSRFFNFATFRASWYKPSEWSQPNAWEKWNSGGKKKFYPADWPDAPHAYWSWSYDVDPVTKESPKGLVYFRAEFETTETEPTPYSFIFAVDDQADVYVDGELVMTTAEHAWTEVNRIDMELEAGPHVIALKAYNYRGPGPANSKTKAYAGVLGALFRAGDATAPTAANLIFTTGNTSKWRIMPYPDVEPGWATGEIISTLMSDAEGRGVRFPNNITKTYTSEVDSYGNEWRTPLAWEFAVGSTYEEVVQTLEESECDIWIDPATLNLNIYNKRGYDLSLEGTDPNPVVLNVGHNLIAGDETGQAAIANAMVVHTPSGWKGVHNTNSASKDKYGRIEASLSTDLDGLAANNLFQKIFDQKSLPEKAATFTIYPSPGSVPFEDFNVGDWVSAPNDAGVMEKRRVVSIAVTENPNTGEPVFAVEFDTIFKDRQTELENAVNKATGGSSSLGGFSPSQTALPDDVLKGPPPREVVLAQPDEPTWISVTDEGVWSATGLPTATVYMQWTPVTTSQGDEITDVIGYELWGRREKEVEFQLLGTYEDTYATLEGVPSGSSWVYKLRALARVNGEGLFSAEYPYTAIYPVLELEPPSAPSLVSALSMVVASWDGLLGGETPPSSFRRVFAEYREGTTGNFRATATFATKEGQVASIAGTRNTEMQVRLVAEDTMGRLSDPSPITTITVVGVGVPDVDQELLDDIQEALDTAEEVRGKADQALAEAITARETVDGKNSIVASETEPEPRGEAWAQGDLWYQLSSEGNLIGVKIWNGTQFVPYRMVADSLIVPGTVGNTTIQDGAIDTDKLVANAVIAEKLTLTSLDNLVDDPTFETFSKTWRTTGTSWNIVDTTGGPGRSVKHDASGSADLLTNGLQFTVVAGEEFQVYVRAQNAQTTDFRFGIRWLKEDRTLLTWDYLPIAGGSPWTDYSEAFTAPEGATYGQFAVQSGTATAESFWMTKPRVLRRATGELIVDGAITSRTLLTEEIWADQAWFEQAQVGVLTAGIIEAEMLSPSVGDSLNLSANGSIDLLLGPIRDGVDEASSTAGEAQGAAEAASDAAQSAQDSADGAQDSVDKLSAYYRFTSAEAIIGRPGSAYTFHMSNTRASFKVNGQTTTYWEANIMYVPEMSSPQVTLANHRIETYGERTVVRSV